MKRRIILIYVLVIGIYSVVSAQEVSSYPYVEDFESDSAFSAWQNGLLNSFTGTVSIRDNHSVWIRWMRGTGCTQYCPNFRYTGPYGGYQSESYAHVYSPDLYDDSGRYGDPYALLSPVFRLDDITSATLSMKYHTFYDGSSQATSSATLKIVGSINQGPLIEFFTTSGDQLDAWHNIDIDLSQYLSQNGDPTVAQFAIVYSLGGSCSKCDAAFDRFEIKNVTYRPGFDPNNYTTQYGWEKVDSLGLLLPDGKLAINSPTIDPNFDLWVNGSMKAGEILVLVDSVPDYVFDEDYILKSLPEIESYIEENHHLPGIPSETEMEASGADLGSLNMKLLEKIEELTLHMIEMNKEIERLKTANQK